MPAVISGTYTSGFTLSVNPTTITGAVETTGSYAVANLTHAGFSLVNDGTLEGNAYGVKLRDGSTLINNAGALISAVSSAVGIYLSGGILYPQFQVYNNGNIEGGSLITQFQHAGVYILARGSIVNGTLVQSPTVAGTFINGPNGVVTGDQGVRASNAEIINNGTIFSDLPVAYNGPDIGLVQNYGTFINGTHGVLLDGADTNDDIINNFGSIGGGVFLGGTAAVTNALGATITNYLAERGGIEMDAGSQSYNYKGTVTTTISDPTVTNYGFIGGLNGVYEGTGVFINKGIVVGAGTLASHSGLYAQDHGNGISLYANQAAFSVTQGVTNDLGATIIGARYGAFMSVNGNYSTKYETFANLGLVEGSIGVELGAGEVVDTGTIASTNTAGADIAVQFEFSRYGTTYANHSTLVLNPGAVLGGTIGGFDTAATILLNGFTATSDSFAAGELVLQSGAASRTLAFAGSFVTPSFIVTTVATGTEITLEPAVCYLPGTRILTPAGEVPVECLHIGDAVITRFGGYRPVKWIGRQSFARRFIRHNREQWPVRIAAGALGAGLPRRDLFVSPGHSMFIGGTLILAAALVNGVTITQDDAPDEIHYHQIELETHDCVLAEGAWSETYADTPGWRAKFHNAAEFWALYPDHRPPDEQILCADRPLAGPALAAALSPIVARAAAGLQPGPLYGYIDEGGPGIVRGWAWDAAHPHLPVMLELSAGGRRLAHLLACDPRSDVAAAGFGTGRCGFSFTPPPGLPPAGILIRRATDGARLTGTARAA